MKKITVILATIIFATISYSQNILTIPKDFNTVKLIAKKTTSGKLRGKNPCYLAIDYDFGDSISILINNAVIYSQNLLYKLPDIKEPDFPYNRKLFSLSKLYRKNIKKGTCTILLWHLKKSVSFKISKRFQFYEIELLKNSNDHWNLQLLDVSPWSD